MKMKEKSLWDQPGVPHKGWVFEDMEDLGEPDETCQMCRHREIRYVHIMTHSEYPAPLRCGCVCASKMELDPGAAVNRERAFKSKVRRRKNAKKNWPGSFSVNSKGNHQMQARDGTWIGVYHQKGAWKAYATKGEDKVFLPDTFATADEAKDHLGQLLNYLIKE